MVRSPQTLLKEGLPIDADDEDMFYLRRLEGGLFTLQNIDVILAWLVMEDDGVRCHPPALLRPHPLRTSTGRKRTRS